MCMTCDEFRGWIKKLKHPLDEPERDELIGFLYVRWDDFVEGQVKANDHD